MKASWVRRDRVTTHVEYLVPIGSTPNELMIAMNAAGREWQRATEHAPNAARPDDWAVIVTDDQHVIIRFDVPRIEASNG